MSVLGLNFIRGKAACHFGDDGTVEGTAVSPKLTLCLPPPSQKAGAVPVEVSFENLRSNNKVRYKYQPLPTIGAIAPTFGVESGGTSGELPGPAHTG